MEKPIKAKTRFENTDFSCSQAVFSTLAPEFGINEENALKISSAFGGGMMRHGEVCGAVTGSLMTLGLKLSSAQRSRRKPCAMQAQML